jgi:ABC-2 type transport system permease protein
LAAAALAVAFVLSAVGSMAEGVDAGGLRVVSAWPAWLSPIGWGEQVRPFGGNDWRPIALFVAMVPVAGMLASGEISAGASCRNAAGPRRPHPR